MCRRVCYLLILALTATHLAASTEDTVRPFLEQHCLDCHGEHEPSGQIRLDRLGSFGEADGPLWTRVYQVLTRGEMPPQEEPPPTAEDVQRVRRWIVAQAKADLAARRQRRLNRREFSAALQDATGIAIDFGAGLPADGQVQGFDTGRQALHDAADSVAQLLEVSRRAVDSIRFLEPHRGRSIEIDFRDHQFNDFRKFVDSHWKSAGIFTRSKRLRCQEGVGIYLPTQWSGDRGNSFLAVPAPADKRAALQMTLRVAARRPFAGLPLATLWVKIGGTYVDHVVIGEQPQTLSYAVRMEDHLVEGGVMKVMLQSMVEVPYAVEGFENDDRSKPDDNIPGGIGIYRPKFDRKRLRDPDQQPVPTIVVESIKLDYDYCASWPPTSWHADVRDLEDSDACAAELLQLWMDRAWRRPTNETERARFLTLYGRLRDQGLSFDDALRATFQAVLMGGPFRFLPSPADVDPTIAQHALASRLSFMFVGAPPDEPLRRLAKAGRLHQPQVLNAQVDRLLADARSEDFFRPFVTQWLHMDQPLTLTMSHFKKQEFRFGRYLKASMRDETIQYVRRLFLDNRPARELVSSDWTMLNDILAVHYGIDGIEGSRLRPVTLADRPEDQRGGGVLGHAGIQSMLCWMGDNWVIYRGAWLLNHVLDDPPPSPPLEVPELDPARPGNHGKTFRQLLAQHQEDAACAVCHKKIDPLGFAFQNFDLSGRWRSEEFDHYHRYELDGKIEWRGEGQTRPVDAAGRLPRGEPFDNYAQFKAQLGEHYLDDIVRGVLKKLTLYGTGRQANAFDLTTIDGIMAEQHDAEYRLRDLVKAWVRSKVFNDGA